MYGVGILRGLAVTLRNFLRPPFTVQYPEQRLPLPRRVRGNELLWSIQRCTLCQCCAKACPIGIIAIESRPTANNLYEAVRFDIDLARCMYCGLCVEACPFDALRMGTSFERATYSFESTQVGIKELVAWPKVSSSYARPQLESSLEEERKAGETWE